MSIKGVKVMVVDDTPVAHKALSFILKQLGCEVVVADSGQKAISLFDASFDAIFIDFHMPNMDGDEATKLIRQKEEVLGKKKITFIVGVTANVSKEIHLACLDAGMNRVVIKPIHSEIIEELFREQNLTN
ncbi:MAG: response regulator [Gammaproteobacteria bacterium]|nr:response regulator [Gammaproteobacteria bacterium]